jgi:hypothetical protein
MFLPLQSDSGASVAPVLPKFPDLAPLATGGFRSAIAFRPASVTRTFTTFDCPRPKAW